MPSTLKGRATGCRVMNQSFCPAACRAWRSGLRPSMRLADAFADADQQFFLVVGLAQIVVDADFGRTLAVLVSGARGDHDDRDMSQALVGADIARQIEAVH